jgi:hypothetical protein
VILMEEIHIIMHGHYTRLMEKLMSQNTELSEDDMFTIDQIKGLLHDQEKETQIRRMEIATQIFNHLIRNPGFMFKKERFRGVVQNKVNEFIRNTRNGQYSELKYNQKDIYDAFIKSLYAIQTLC